MEFDYFFVLLSNHVGRYEHDRGAYRSIPDTAGIFGTFPSDHLSYAGVFDSTLSISVIESFVGVSSLSPIFLITVATFHLFPCLWILKDILFGQLTNSYPKSLSFFIHCHPPAHGLDNHHVSIMLIIKLRRDWRPVPCHWTLSSLCLRHHR